MLNKNLQILHKEMDWLEFVIRQSVTSYLKHEGHEQSWQDKELPDLSESDGPYRDTLEKFEVDQNERLCLALAMAPHIRPQVLDVFFSKNQIYDRGFSEFGGMTNSKHSGFIPTLQTLNFIMNSRGKDNLSKIHEFIDSKHFFIKENIFNISESRGLSPILNSTVLLNKRWLHYFIYGEFMEIKASHRFPTQKLVTNLNWEDLILDSHVSTELNEIKSWLNISKVILDEWDLEKNLKPGYKSLFYGPSGTGKTMAATLLGKTTNRPVYRVNLSIIGSNYIGETEKNLSRVFKSAENKNWILFFDEADSLFGKRSVTHSSSDRHVHQISAYLLQKIEDHPGVIILATKLKTNIDESFTRRFHSMIQFSFPNIEERLLIWQKAFSGKLKLSDKINKKDLARNYELTGGSIMNILRTCAIVAAGNHETVVSYEELMRAVKKELSFV